MMRPSTRRELIAGPAGRIECAIDEPEQRKGRLAARNVLDLPATPAP